MAKNMDRRVRKTRAQLRQGLAELLKEKSIKEITVKELVEKVDINRSTFYLHYTDIYDMMEKIENELTGEIEDLIHTHPVSPFNEDSFLPLHRGYFLHPCGKPGHLRRPARAQRRHLLPAPDRDAPLRAQPERVEADISGEDGRPDILLRLLSLRLHRPGQNLAV